MVHVLIDTDYLTGNAGSERPSGEDTLHLVHSKNVVWCSEPTHCDYTTVTPDKAFAVEWNRKSEVKVPLKFYEFINVRAARGFVCIYK